MGGSGREQTFQLNLRALWKIKVKDYSLTRYGRQRMDGRLPHHNSGMLSGFGCRVFCWQEAADTVISFAMPAGLGIGF